MARGIVMMKLLSVIVYEYFTVKHIYMNIILATQSDKYHS